MRQGCGGPVATGSFNVTSLASHGADAVLSDFTDIASVIDLFVDGEHRISANERGFDRASV